MTSRPPQCIHCKRARYDEITGKFTFKCDAFGDKEIPKEIMSGENLHIKPFPGDNGLQYVPDENARFFKSTG